MDGMKQVVVGAVVAGLLLCGVAGARAAGDSYEVNVIGSDGAVVVINTTSYEQPAPPPVEPRLVCRTALGEFDRFESYPGLPACTVWQGLLPLAGLLVASY
jgi:hypothetical protein